MLDWITDNMGKLILAAIIIMVPLMLWAAYEDSVQWEAYRVAHHCRVTGIVSASTSVGVSSSGKTVTTYTPERNTYTCDGNFTVVR